MCVSTCAPFKKQLRIIFTWHPAWCPFAATWRCTELKPHTAECLVQERYRARLPRGIQQQPSRRCAYTAEQLSRLLVARLQRQEVLSRRRCRELLQLFSGVAISRDIVNRARGIAMDSSLNLDSIAMATLEEEAELMRSHGHFVEVCSEAAMHACTPTTPFPLHTPSQRPVQGPAWEAVIFVNSASELRVRYAAPTRLACT